MYKIQKTSHVQKVLGSHHSCQDATDSGPPEISKVALQFSNASSPVISHNHHPWERIQSWSYSSNHHSVLRSFPLHMFAWLLNLHSGYVPSQQGSKNGISFLQCQKHSPDSGSNLLKL